MPRPRHNQKPTWPYSMNTDSGQARGLKFWYADASAGGPSMFDVSGRGNHGTLATNTGALPSWVPGKDGGRAVSFPGTAGNRVVPVRAFGITGNVPVTISAWTWFTNTASADEVVINFGTDLANQEIFIFRRGTDGKGITECGAGAGAAATATTLAAKVWYHLCAVYTTAQMRIYVNGRREAATNYSSASFGGGQFSFGAYLNAGVYKAQMTGIIDDVRIYNRALSDAEVWTMYNPQTRWELRRQAYAERFTPATVASDLAAPLIEAPTFLQPRKRVIAY